MFVDLVGKAQYVKLLTEIRDEFQFVPGEYFSGRVVRVADDDRLGLFVESGPKFLAVKDESVVGAIKRNVPRHGVRKYGVGSVILVKGLKNDDLVARIHGRHHCGDHSLGRSASDGDLRFRVQVEAKEPHRLFCDRVPKALHAPSDGVLIVVGGDRLDGLELDVLGGRKIRKSLSQIDRSILDRFTAHLTDDRLGKARGLTRDPAFRNFHIRHTIFPSSFTARSGIARRVCLVPRPSAFYNGLQCWELRLPAKHLSGLGGIGDQS